MFSGFIFKYCLSDYLFADAKIVFFRDTSKSLTRYNVKKPRKPLRPKKISPPFGGENKSFYTKPLSSSDVFVERRAHGAGAGEEFAHHALNLLAEAGFIEVEAEDVGAAVEIA